MTVKREVVKSISNIQLAIAEASKANKKKIKEVALTEDQREEKIRQLKEDMVTAAENMDFEKAIALRNEIKKLTK